MQLFYWNVTIDTQFLLLQIFNMLHYFHQWAVGALTIVITHSMIDGFISQR